MKVYCVKAIPTCRVYAECVILVLMINFVLVNSKGQSRTSVFVIIFIEL